MTWYSEVNTEVVAIKTVLVEISDGHSFTTTSVNPLNYTEFEPTDLGLWHYNVNDTTIVLSPSYYNVPGLLTMLVLQPG